MHQPYKTRASWKVSRYLTRVDLPKADTLLLYGGLASRLVEVPGPFRAEVDVLLTDPNSTQVLGDSKLRTLLQEQGILIPEGFDELAFLKKSYERVRSINSGTLGLTLCPTLDCNFRCSYCYQHHLSGIMSEDIQEKVVQFVKEHNPPVTSLSVTWFGGEPLLALSVIEHLSKQFMNLQDGEIKYQASIVTNGWLLKSDVSRLLADLNVRRVQVTLDGARKSHNSRRPLKGGHPTSDKIVHNIANADQRLRINVRVNIDQNNVEGVPQLFEQLDAAGLLGRIGLYFAPVYPYTDVCADTAGSCIIGRTWAKLQGQLHFNALEHGYGGFGLPESKPHYCMADSNQGWVISPHGLMFKCWNDVTQPQNAVFDLSTGTQTQRMKEVQERWTSWNPFNLPDCINCKILPQCLGGCPYLGLQQESPYTHGNCEEVKENLQEVLAIYYLAFKRREAGKQLMERLHEWIPEVVPDPESIEKGKVEEKIDFES